MEALRADYRANSISIEPQFLAGFDEIINNGPNAELLFDQRVCQLITEAIDAFKFPIRGGLTQDGHPIIELKLLSRSPLMRSNSWARVFKLLIENIPFMDPLGIGLMQDLLENGDTTPIVLEIVAVLNTVKIKRSQSCDRPLLYEHVKIDCNFIIFLTFVLDRFTDENALDRIFQPWVIEFVLNRIDINQNHAVVALFALICIKKYCQTSTDYSSLRKKVEELGFTRNDLNLLFIDDNHQWNTQKDSHHNMEATSSNNNENSHFCQQIYSHQYATVAREVFALIGSDHKLNNEKFDFKKLPHVILNHLDATNYLIISPNGLEARNDSRTFESVRATFGQTSKCRAYFYEVIIMTPGIMQIGWATVNAKFANQDGDGIGDDHCSVAYDGCRQLIWFDKGPTKTNQRAWRPGDVLGCLLDKGTQTITFYLNGIECDYKHKEIFAFETESFYPAATFMQFQQARFNFGHRSFVYPPPCDYVSLHGICQMPLRTIQMRVPRNRGCIFSNSASVSNDEDVCRLCYQNEATMMLIPCKHSGICHMCAIRLTHCPYCRMEIKSKQINVVSSASASNDRDSNDSFEVPDEDSDLSLTVCLTPPTPPFI